MNAFPTLTSPQCAALRELLDPYIQRVQALERELAIYQATASHIVAAYCKGMGIDEKVQVDLDTGVITSKEAVVSINGQDPA